MANRFPDLNCAVSGVHPGCGALLAVTQRSHTVFAGSPEVPPVVQYEPFIEVSTCYDHVTHDIATDRGMTADGWSSIGWS